MFSPSIPIQCVEVRLLDASSKPFPAIRHGDRLCVAVPAGQRFVVESRVERADSHRYMYVVAVDGRDTLDNSDASARAGGLVTGTRYECRGFRVSDQGVREFVCAELGRDATTAERSGTADCSGLVSVAVYAEGERHRAILRSLKLGQPATSRGSGVIREQPTSAVGTPTRGVDVVSVADMSAVLCVSTSSTVASSSTHLQPAAFSAGPSVGAAAGEFVEDRVGRCDFERGDLVGVAVVEYDTPEGWMARGVSFAPLDRNPWPGDARRFCDPSTL